MSKILIISNKYQFFGGSEQVVLNEIKLFQKHGDQVFHYQLDNKIIKQYNIFDKIKFVFNAVYNIRVKKKISQIIKRFEPDVIHVHNIYPLISLSVYVVLKNVNVPVLQSFHDHRLSGLCPQGNAYRSGKTCEKCFSGNFIYSIYYKCVKENILLSTIYSMNLFLNKRFKIIERSIDYAIVFNDYMKNRLLTSGFNSKKIYIKPHFIFGDKIIPTFAQENYIVYIGAVSNHKGVLTLLKAYSCLKNKINLKIVGTGDCDFLAKKFSENNDLEKVEFLGEIRNEKTKFTILKNSLFSIIPSECYETFCLTAIESMGCGVPIISTKIGSLKYLVQDGKNGLTFEVGNHKELTLKMEHLINNKTIALKFGKNGRKQFLKNYTDDFNYKLYQTLIDK
jgi:glycosyltransferase involved in cell wall biosynthesis